MMDKTVNQKAWFLVLPVFLIVAFSAVLPLMTVVNYSVQDTFGNNQFFWNGVGWFKEFARSVQRSRRAFLRVAAAKPGFLRDHPRHRSAARHSCRAVDAA
jgi:ABC-type sugar transport system permease subunit